MDNKNFLNKDSSKENKKEASNTIYSGLIDFFFEKITYGYWAYSDFGGGGTTNENSYNANSRFIDSSGGKLMSAGRETRTRILFYVKNLNMLDGYILMPGVYEEAILPSTITTAGQLTSFVGLRFFNGDVSVVTKEYNLGMSETPIEIDVKFIKDSSGNYFTQTFLLESVYNDTTTELFLDGKSLGSYKSKLSGQTQAMTFYPFFALGRSTDGTITNIVAEHVQWIQSRD